VRADGESSSKKMTGRGNPGTMEEIHKKCKGEDVVFENAI
jgi:hypothetical protein